MAAYVIANVTVQDTALEGTWAPTRLVVLEFPSLEQARRWYDSEDYREPKALRLKSALSDVVMVEGV